MLFSVFVGEEMKKNLFFVDAETDGLYGPVLSIAVIITNFEGCELERHYWGIQKAQLQIKSEWVQQNVVPIMGEYEPCRSEKDMLDRFWKIWAKYHDSAYAVADVSYPVECTVFHRCILENAEERGPEGPFPLLDLSSILIAKGIDPLAERRQLVDMQEKKMHNALTDVKVSIEIWKKYMN